MAACPGEFTLPQNNVDNENGDIGEFSEIGEKKGKVYIVAGSISSTIRSIFEELLTTGASVVLVIPVDAPAPSCITVVSKNLNIIYHDISSNSGWWQVVRSTLDRYGRIDGVVNDGSIFKSSVEKDDASYARMIEEYIFKYRIRYDQALYPAEKC
jgi:NAD(P)-dependent dehydrogenase (short-subunit alcohol dehydrogenase family)